MWRKGATSQDSTGANSKEYNQEVQVAAGAMWCIQPRFAHMAGKRLTTMSSDLALRHVASGEENYHLLRVWGSWGLGALLGSGGCLRIGCTLTTLGFRVLNFESL